MRPARLLGRSGALLAALLLALFAVAPAADAHDVRPAYLQIDPLAPERYALFWRTPLLSGAPLPVVLELPAEAVALAPPQLQTLPGSRIERHLIEVPGGLAGRQIRFLGLEATITDVLVRIGNADGGYTTELVRPSRPWIEPDPERGSLGVALTYLHQGIEHILLGPDHLLFVAALLLILRDWRMLLMTITAFTVAHSITLTLATFGLVRLPSGPVEILIALSIVLVAVEAVRRERGSTSIAIRRPWIVAFAFGLLHGFGFAGALRELGLPEGDIPLALLTFNLGVEIGQLAFVGVVLLAVRLLRGLVPLPRQAVIASAYVIGTIGAFWSAERIDGVFF